MRIFELIYPGTWLQGLPEDVGREVEALLYVIESHLADAAIGPAMFQEARTRPISRPDWNDASGQVRRLVERGMEVEQHWQRQAEGKPSMTPEERWGADERARFEPSDSLPALSGKPGRRQAGTYVVSRSSMPTRFSTRSTAYRKR